MLGMKNKPSATSGSQFEKFVYKCCYTYIFNSLSAYVSSYPTTLEVRTKVKYPDTATLLNFMLMTATDMCLDEDTITFDAVVEAEIQVENSENGRYDIGKQWFRMSCEVTIKDKITNFVCNKIELYHKIQLNSKRKGACDAHIVPIIGWKQFDDEATGFS
jgi:hypothetical protein